MIAQKSCCAVVVDKRNDHSKQNSGNSGDFFYKAFPYTLNNKKRCKKQDNEV